MFSFDVGAYWIFVKFAQNHTNHKEENIMKQWFKSTLAVVLAFVMVLGYVLIPGNTLTAQAANTGNAQQDVTIFPSEMIDGVEWTGRFPSVTRLNDGSLIATCYWAPVSSHAPYAYGDPMGSITVAFGSADGTTWSESTLLISPEKLGQWGLGVWRDDAGNFYYNAEDAAANGASIQVEARDPNLAVMNDGTLLLTFFMRVPAESNFLGKTMDTSTVFTSPATFIMYSKDNGQSWSSPTEIKTDNLSNVIAKRGTMAIYDDGQILIPLYGRDGVSCVLAELNEDGTWNFIREALVPSTIGAGTESALAVTTLNGQEVTYNLIRASGMFLISYDRGQTWENVSESVEISDSWFEGAAEKLQQPSLIKMDNSNKLICTWTQAIGTLGQRNVYGKIYTPGEDWNKTSAVLLYKHNTRGTNDIGDATTIELTNRELFTIYYDVASRCIGGVFSSEDELTVLRSKTEMNSTASDWKIYEMDFENYNAGDKVLVQDDLWMSVYGSTTNTVVEENGNKYVSSTTWANSGSNACWWFNNVSTDATVSFDFRFPDAVTDSGWQQLLLGLGGDWNESTIVFSNAPGVTKMGVYNTTLEEDVFAAGDTWYSVKIVWDDYKAYVKIWEQGADEPADYTYIWQNSNFNVDSKVFLKTQGGNSNGERIQLDNICISKKTDLSIVEIDEDTLGCAFDRDMTYELPVPTVTWSSSDPSVIKIDESGSLTYVGTGTATITAACNNLTATKEIEISGWNFIDLDFENDAAGDWTVPTTYGMSFTNYNKTGATKTIVADGDNNYLKLAHTTRYASELWFNAGPGATLQFDFRMPSTLASGKWQQLNISLGNTSYNPQWQFNDSAGTTLVRLYDGAAKYAANNVWTSGSSAPWYTVKLVWDGSTATFQLWAKDDPSTLLYDQTVTHSGFTTTNAIRIKYANNEVSSGVLLDNITLSKTTSLSIVDNGDSLGYSFTPDVTTETPVPNVVWASDNESVVTIDENGVMTYVGAGTATVTATCDNLTATKEITVCAVSFDAGAHGENPETVLVRSGNTVTAPEMADNGDYIFKGWYNGKNAFDFSAPVTESVTLTAKWANKNDIYYFDFEDVEPGNYLVQDGNGLWMDQYDMGWSWVEKEENADNQHLILSGAEGTATTDFWFNNVPVGTTLSFDFAMPTASAGWDRLAIAFGSSDVDYSWRFEQWQGATSVKYPNAAGEEQAVNEAFAIGTWYSVKMDWNGDYISVKLWERGTDEPADYTFTTQNACFTADNKVRINYVTDSQSYLHLDNIRFYDAGEPAVESWNITLSDDIGLNFALNVADGLVNQTTVEITVEGVTKAVTVTDAIKNESGLYLISVNLAAAQMTEEVQVKVLLDGAVAECKTYTIRQYADVILAGDYSEETKNLVRTMLVYGGKAQNYFSYNTGNYADIGIEIEAAEVPTEVAPKSVSGSVEGLSYYGASMLFTSKNAVRYYFILESGADISTYTFTAGDKTLTPAQKNGMYYVDVAEINPQDLDNSIVVEVTCGEEKLSVSYSPMNYIVRKYYGNGSDELKALLQAMYGYHLAAEAYLATV